MFVWLFALPRTHARIYLTGRFNIQIQQGSICVSSKAATDPRGESRSGIHSEKSNLKRRGKCPIKIPLAISSSFENIPLIIRVLLLTTKRKFL